MPAATLHAACPWPVYQPVGALTHYHLLAGTSALGGPLMGHLADRVGQRGVLLVSALVHTAAIALLLLTASVLPGPSVPLLVAASLLVGASCPQVSPLARVRWRGLTGGDRPRGVSDGAGPGGCQNCAHA